MSDAKIGGQSMNMSLSEISALARNVSQASIHISFATGALVRSGNQQTQLYEELCQLLQNFERLVSRIQPSVLVKDVQPVLGVDGVLAPDNRS
jgi:hypothetical protein